MSGACAMSALQGVGLCSWPGFQAYQATKCRKRFQGFCLEDGLQFSGQNGTMSTGAVGVGVQRCFYSNVS